MNKSLTNNVASLFCSAGIARALGATSIGEGSAQSAYPFEGYLPGKYPGPSTEIVAAVTAGNVIAVATLEGEYFLWPILVASERGGAIND